MARWSSCALVVLGFAVVGGPSLSAQSAAAPTATAPASADAGLAALYARLEQALVAGEPSQILAATSAASTNGDRLSAFAQGQAFARAVRAVVRERDRAPIEDAAEGSAYRMLLEVFVEYDGGRASARTWTIDATRTPADGIWRLSDAESLSSADGLNRLALDPNRQFRVRDLAVRAEDLLLTFPSGVAYVATTADGETGMVVIGDGTMQFTPTPAMERTQLRIFSGETELRTPIGAAFLRYHPIDRADHIGGTLTEEPVSASNLRRAQAIFEEEIGKSFGIELADLSRERWSLVPPVGDFLAEIRTKGRFGTLTYVRSGGEPEDISLFQRARHRNVAVYASAQHLKTRGTREFSEDDEADYDVSHYSIGATIDPDRQQIEGRTEMRLTVRAAAVGTLTFKLAESLNVYGVVGQGLGRLLALRVRGQNAVLINLPRTLVRGTTITLTITYGGRLAGASADREAVAVQQDTSLHEELATAEPRLLYSNRSYWYPQAPVTDYATGVLRLTVPDKRGCVASGTPASGNPVRVTSARGRRPALRLPRQPAGALLLRGDLASRPGQRRRGRGAVAGQRRGAGQPASDGPRPRRCRRRRRRSSASTATCSATIPTATLTLAAVDDALPGGHSPAYFALVNQPLPATKFTWANDPVAFEGYPQFFLAHEIAHQFWGGAVGWESYHEQWISEGFAQYFALLYAERSLDPARVEDIRRKLRTTATAYADQGPIWLGYRLGHLQEDGRVFRAVVYNKSALVLHMLRRWVGDDAFFRGLRSLYAQSRYTKIGTRHVQHAFEAESGLDLTRFFEGWIRTSDTPRLRASFEPAGGSVTVRIDQLGPVMDVPVTVSVVYASGATDDHLVKLSQGSTFVQLPGHGPGARHRAEPRRAGADRRRTRRPARAAGPAMR